ncbi:3-methyl-2-oxobutanoate hydroxymethyltransferase [Tessaracoccus sp. ZS01]|uniref:3-methyl-2-oxobutanoate hydroxymethyltransferase n=1 Tax=Tessaracoccus sp. ZS01 TaxID=1906324 RepID=UPI00096E518F|nr:3-methyl-2-oxobutanoate hydroxymethyltransferase [Tessaracoccus sp. ZS01]MCG6567849.1 3-methyl-2-oxobutanoate hydroxymethyltransferase [Tessaracoccus sp. ZS01]OMG55334.1 3-methyl-2-oxobutanoate hydroxymethyltransferase [Tessaracoccus sp. ZS01]
MSSRPPQNDAARRRVTPPSLAAMKRDGERIVMVTAYDYPGALAAEEAGVDVVLVGDSGAMTVLGHENTAAVTVDEMLVLTAAVRRGLTTPLLVADLPFGSYEVSDEQAVATALRFMKEAGSDAVKLEGGGAMPASRAAAIVAAGIPVMGHVGLTPQTATALGGFKAQGRTAASALRVADEARKLQDVGCFAVVFEAIPAEVAADIREMLDIVVIGIGAGPATDGQVLVFHDLLGLGTGGSARFVKRYADLHSRAVGGLRAFADEVRDGSYPAPEHCYGIDGNELAAFRLRSGTAG